MDDGGASPDAYSVRPPPPANRQKRRRMSPWLIVALVLLVALALFGGLFAWLRWSADQQLTGVRDAVDAFVAPAEFTIESDRVTPGLNEASRSVRFSTELSLEEACDRIRAAVTDWAGAEPEPVDVGPTADQCQYDLREVPAHPHLDYASGRVAEWASDGGVVVTAWFLVSDPTDWMFRSYDEGEFDDGE